MGSDCPILAGPWGPLGVPGTPASINHTWREAAGLGKAGGVSHDEAAFGLSVKAALGGGPCRGGQRLPRRSRAAPRSLLLSSCHRSPLPVAAVLSASCCLLGAGLKCWVPGSGVLEVTAIPPHRALGEDVVNEQLTCQGHAEQEPGARALQEA